MILRAAAFSLPVLALVSAADAESPCPEPGTRPDRSATSQRCRTAAPRKVEPYDPDRLKAGSRPGFIDLGGGTEIQVGGRARMEFDSRR